MITLVAAFAFLLSLLLAPQRGVLAQVARGSALRRRIAKQNLLRSLYEAGETVGSFQATLAASGLSLRHSLGRGRIERALRSAAKRGWVERAEDGWRLTASGFDAAARVVRAHRLWEIYLVEQADIAADHVDRDADQIEHILPAHVLRALEDRLRQAGRLPSVAPQSPHPLGVSDA
jgi:manganese/zinc/iron transport system permease protein